MLSAVLGGCAIGYTVKEARSQASAPTPPRVALAAHPMTKNALADAVRGCGGNDLVACLSVAGLLESTFAGADPTKGGPDRALARTLASAAIVVIHDDAASAKGAQSPEQRILAASLHRCASDDLGECERVAGVLRGLFSGADARLQHSNDELLARAFAKRLIAVAENDAAPPLFTAVR
ncbi:MAG TPA: hypothetical protein VF945_00475 [Polyangia bacterium]